MSYRKRVILAVSTLFLLSALFVTVMAQNDEAAAGSGELPNAPPYGVRGPHLVGTSDMVINGETPLEITVWYPASNGGNLEEVISYPYEIKMDDPLGTVALAAFDGQATRNAPYDLSTGPYPLVILSPGFAMGSTTYAWLAEHLASHGFVVISPEHNEQLDPSLLWHATIVRPQEILTVLSFIDEQVRSGGTFEGLINNDLVAVIGHSYGGYTALVAGGARLDAAGFEAICRAAYEVNDPVVFLCEALLPHVVDMAELAGLDAVPEGLWPSWGDPRVDAIVSLAGDAVVFDQAGLAEINVPVMAIGGTRDTDSPYMWGTHPTYEYVSSPTKVRIALKEAEHMIFTGPCESIPWFLKLFSDEFCSDPGWDRNHAHDLINHFTTAFLLAELKQDSEAAAFLVPDIVELPGMVFEAQGY